MQKTKSGSGLIFAVVLLFVILGMVITLSSITVLETKMNQKTKSSVGAFYNSESGVEWALNKIATSTATNITGVFGAPGSGVSPVGADYKVYLLDKDGKVIINGALDPSEIKAVRSVGTQGGETQRAIEAAVASGSCSDTPIVLTADVGKINDTGKKLIIVAYTGASVDQVDLIGEMCASSTVCHGEGGSSLTMVATDSSGASTSGSRASVTFIVPPGYTYRVRMNNSAYNSLIGAQAWELCSN